jgi:hypothetical protein
MLAVLTLNNCSGSVPISQSPIKTSVKCAAIPRDIIKNLRRKPTLTDADGYRLSLQLVREWTIQNETAVRLAALYRKCRAT